MTLERLLLLGIDGYRRSSSLESSPQRFRVVHGENFESSLLEAASYGATLESAAATRLEELAAATTGVVHLVDVLASSLRAGLPGLSKRANEKLRQLVGEERSFEALGQGLTRLVGMLRHAGLVTVDRDKVGTLIDAATDRALWVVEGIVGQSALSQPRVTAVKAIRDALLQGDDFVTVPSSRVQGVFTRIAFGNSAPSDLRGAALGGLVSLSFLTADQASEYALRSLQDASPQDLGDFLAGLLSLAREVIMADEGIVSGLDEALANLTRVDFQLALPSLRLAFHSLPPPERAAFAAQVAARYGAQGHELTTRLQHPPELLARAHRLEDEVATLKKELGLDGQ